MKEHAIESASKSSGVNCEICGKPCGAPMPGAKVYHMSCAKAAYDKARAEEEKE